ncbi:MAG TPA: energy transducer TonB [Sphingomicrobium sp.]|jgi:protein TonB|nr:energy transducer TonB [Sphingomicrobium sp.]
MGTYASAASRTERSKAIAAVVAVHVALAFVILTGLNVHMVSQAVDRLATFTVVEPAPPPAPPAPVPKSHQVEKAAGAPAPMADPSPIVAPPPKLPLPSPVPAATLAGTGNSSASGAASSGLGTGAGGSGNGMGGGGDYARFTPARRITKIPNSEYRHLAATGLRRGRVGVTIKVETDGRASNCRVARSSGDTSIDALMCRLTLRYVRFDPARDPAGRPVAQDITFYPNWWRP